MKLAIGITGASGAIYAKLLVDRLLDLRNQIESCGLIISDNARTVWEHELDEKPQFDSFFQIWEKKDFFAPVASGSAGYDGVIICPCSMGTLGRIASGVSDDLLTRASDVMLKERKKLILVTRETPLNLIHIHNMKLVTNAGGIIFPASPSFYSKPKTIEEAAITVIDRVLQLAGLQVDSYKWGQK